MEYFIKVIKSLGNRGILLKGTIKKAYNKKRRIPLYCSCSVNESWLTINEKCTHTIS